MTEELQCIGKFLHADNKIAVQIN